MTDSISRLLAGYAVDSPAEMDEQVRHETKRRVLDTLGVAIGALQQPGPRAARRYAYRTPQAEGSLVWGTPFRSTAEAATLANGVATRYFDFNDTYLGLEPLHPSDMIAGLIAVGEQTGASGTDLLTAIAVAYEVGVTLCDTFSVRKHGWDHPVITAIGACCGLSRLMGFTTTQAEDALAITVVPHAPMRQTRAGELSMWKGYAAADAVRHAVYACQLAADGVQGPFAPFEGEMGMVRQLLGGEIPNPAAMAPLERLAPTTRIAGTYIKAWPVEYHAQSAVDAALALRKEIGDPRLIRRVRISTFKASYEIIGKDPEKWQPRTRETADHSLPYITVAALLDGRVNLDTFRPERITAPDVRQLLGERTTLDEADDLTAGYPDGIPNRIEVETEDGRVLTKEVRFPPGHAHNPLSDELVMEKYSGMAVPVLGDAGAAILVEEVMNLELLPTITQLTSRLVV